MTPNHNMYISARINGVFAWAWVITIRHFRVWNFHVWSPVKYNTLKSKLNNPKNGARRIIPLDLYWLERPSERLLEHKCWGTIYERLVSEDFPQICIEIVFLNILGNDQVTSASSAGYMRSMHIRMRSRTSGSRKIRSASLGERKIKSLILKLSTEIQSRSSEINTVLSPADMWNEYPQYFPNIILYAKLPEY